MQVIDQERRRDICRRIMQGDTGAIVDLASLYHDAGHRFYAGLVLAWTLTQAKQHARVIIAACKEVGL